MSTDTTTKKLELKPLEIGVGAGAAVVAAFASSYLGTAGTLTGAAVASVIGTVSTSVLRASADRGAESLRRSTERLRPSRTGPELGEREIDPDGSRLAGAPDVADLADVAEPAGAERDRVLGATGAATGAGTSGIGSGTGTLGTPRRAVRPRWVLLGAGAAASFALALGAITGIESAAGKPLAAITGAESGGGTTLGRATGADRGTPGTDTDREPTTTPTSTPSPSGEPTATPTGSAGSGPEGSPTGEPTATGSPEAPLSPPPAPSAPSATVPAPTPTGAPLPTSTP